MARLEDVGMIIAEAVKAELKQIVADVVTEKLEVECLLSLLTCKGVEEQLNKQGEQLNKQGEQLEKLVEQIQQLSESLDSVLEWAEDPVQVELKPRAVRRSAGRGQGGPPSKRGRKK